jgi:putative heme-binding domain-containing protein
LRTIPSGWYQAVQIALDPNKPSLWHDGLQAARAMPAPQKFAPEYRAALLRHATTERHDDRQRLTALAVLAALPGSEKFPDVGFTLALERLHRDQPAPLRSLAAEVLTRVPLESGQLVRLAEALATTSPLELSRLLEAFGRSTEEQVGLKLVAVLRRPEIRAGLRSETVRPYLKAYGPAVQKEADRLYAELDAALKDQRARLDKMLAELKEGDVRRGQQVFHQTKAACASCHKIGYVGGTVGPDLTRVGAIRGRRDLLESILFPSASFTRSYEPFLVTTTQGQTYNGIIKKDGLDEIVLTITADRQVRILRENIEEMRPAQVSLMPSGLEQQLSPQDLADLLAFLGACK